MHSQVTLFLDRQIANQIMLPTQSFLKDLTDIITYLKLKPL